MSSSSSLLNNIWSRGLPDQLTPKPSSAQTGTLSDIDPFDSTSSHPPSPSTSSFSSAISPSSNRTATQCSSFPRRSSRASTLSRPTTTTTTTTTNNNNIIIINNNNNSNNYSSSQLTHPYYPNSNNIDELESKTPMPASPRGANNPNFFSNPHHHPHQYSSSTTATTTTGSSSSSHQGMAASALKAIGTTLHQSDFSFTSSPIARIKKHSMSQLARHYKRASTSSDSVTETLQHTQHDHSHQQPQGAGAVKNNHVVHHVNQNSSHNPNTINRIINHQQTNPNQSTTSSTTKNSLALPPKGLLSVKIISANSLRCASSYSRPYVVAQYDNNEFVSREPISEEEDETKGVVKLSQSRENEKKSILGLKESKVDCHKLNSDGNGIYCLSGQNPIWKQEVDFDVAQHETHHSIHQTLHVSVYDRSIGDFNQNTLDLNQSTNSNNNNISGIEGVELFMGETEIKLNFDELSKKAGWCDRLYKLTMKNVDSSTTIEAGEIRIQLKYQERQSKKSLDVTDFEFLKMIGRGTFGRVFQVRKKDTKRIYAMKVLSKKEVIDKKEVQHTIGERNILQQSNQCPFLLGLKFSFQSPGELFLVMDYKSGGELFHHLQKEGRFTEERARFYTAEIVMALEHLHKYNIVYRDLKPENILLDATGHIVLCDFGLSKPNLSSDELTTTFCGTTEYLAPEVLLDDHGYSKLVDFWSLGVLLFEMCCGWSPFYAEDNQQMYKNICFGKIKFPRGVIGDDGKQFVKGLLNRNPKHRLGAQNDAEDLKKHGFFKTMDWQLLANRQIVPTFKPYIDSDDSVVNFDTEFTQLDIEEQLPMTIRGRGDFDEDDRSADWLKQASSYVNHGFGSHSIGNQTKVINPSSIPVPLSKTVEKRGEDESTQDHFLGFSYHGESEITTAGHKFGMSKIE